LAKSAALQNTPAGFWKIAPSRSSAKSGFIRAANTESTDRYVGWFKQYIDFSSSLREKGFSADDEKKIIAMKDFIMKQAQASKA